MTTKTFIVISPSDTNNNINNININMNKKSKEKRATDFVNNNNESIINR